MKYQFNENGEVSNAGPTIDQGDFRAYSPETVTTAQGQKIEMQLCANLIEGRWEYWYATA